MATITCRINKTITLSLTEFEASDEDKLTMMLQSIEDITTMIDRMLQKDYY